MRRFKKKKNLLFKIKIGIILCILMYVSYMLIIRQIKYKTIKTIKENAIKTNNNNIYILEKKEKKELELVFINDFNEIKKFDNLDAVGHINFLEPILIYKNKKYGYLKQNGEILLLPEYEYISNFYEGKSIIKKGKVGVINTLGKEIISLDYDEIFLGQNNLFILNENGYYFSYDLKNKKKIDVEAIYEINKTMLIYSKNKKFGVMDFSANILIPNEYTEISKYIDKVFVGEKNFKYSLYNLKNEKISKDYDYIEQIGNNEYRGGTNTKGKYAFLSEDFSTDEKYDEIEMINNNFYLGRLSNNEVEIINLNKKKTEAIKMKNMEKYLEELKGEKSNE